MGSPWDGRHFALIGYLKAFKKERGNPLFLSEIKELFNCFRHNEWG